ncbi:Cornichon domain-containing protein [Rhizoctonia solani AG-1 IA]|uniref:Cornichon domain-containing protein n=1 Tax=Thanatephorus cucumeris (strain AG1-IA) TaxID=983506 RepID=L8WVN3_THACA|nr:Cornichon domain-containing protein [Rhizoctonia solani AG-1 IA]
MWLQDGCSCSRFSWPPGFFSRWSFSYVPLIIMFSDLECDYINPIDLCNKLNAFVLPEMGAHAFLTFLFLVSFQWIALLLNLPLVAFNVNKVRQNSHTYDATEIFRTLSQHKKESFIKLGLNIVLARTLDLTEC